LKESYKGENMEFGKIERGGVENYVRKVRILKSKLDSAEAIFIGAGAGLSNAAGLNSTEIFEHYFSDFISKYNIENEYKGLFYPIINAYELWAYRSRLIWCYSYETYDNGTYENLATLLRDKNYFVMTSNIDNQLIKNGIDKERIFYMKGNYNYFQCSEPCHQEVYNNREYVIKMMKSQGFVYDGEAKMSFPSNGKVKMEISEDLVPTCPKCNRPMTLNVDLGAHFVRPDGWYIGSAQKDDFLLKNRDKKILYLELGSGPYMKEQIRHPFWERVMRNRNATYACINLGECSAPEAIIDRSILIDADIKTVLNDLVKL
jgi:NAD-dependent SIR2 family protein deacetylase